jgi:general stress protein YciG
VALRGEMRVVCSSVAFGDFATDPEIGRRCGSSSVAFGDFATDPEIGRRCGSSSVAFGDFATDPEIGRRCGSSSVGRASASQAEGRGFESRLPLCGMMDGRIGIALPCAGLACW